MLVLLGSVGLMVHAHEALPELACLAALCGALAVLPHAARKPLAAGALFGVALGCAALSAIWIARGLAVRRGAARAPRLPGMAHAQRGGSSSVLASSLRWSLAASWPLALAWRAPEAFALWRIVAWQPIGDPLANLRYFLVTGSWFALPGWPLALWAAWSLRRRWHEPRLFVPAVASLLMLAAAAYWGPPQDVNLIPLLAPLALLAYQGALVPAPRRGRRARLVRRARLRLLRRAGVVRLVRDAHRPAARASPTTSSRPRPRFSLEFKLLSGLFALALTLGWLYLVFFTTRSPMRSLLRWAAGIVLLWGMFAMLWMPWADYQKSYRNVALQLRSKIPVGASCIAQQAARRFAGRGARLPWRHPRRAPSTSSGRTPARCCWCRAARSTSSTGRAPAGSSSPTSAGPATAASATACTACRMNTRSPTECPSWAKLAQHAESWRGVHLRELFAADVTRGRQFAAEAPGVRYDYSRQRLGAMTLRLLTHLAAERGFAEWREALLAGSAVNSTEKRAAWHTALRAGDAAPAGSEGHAGAHEAAGRPR